MLATQLATSDARMVEYLKSHRTSTQAQVDKRTAVHDARDLTPRECASILEGSNS
jgi:hypothetical protein